MFKLRWVANDELSLSLKVLLEQAHPRLFKEMKVVREALFVSRLGSQGDSTSSVTVASASVPLWWVRHFSPLINSTQDTGYMHKGLVRKEQVSSIHRRNKPKLSVLERVASSTVLKLACGILFC